MKNLCFTVLLMAGSLISSALAIANEGPSGAATKAATDELVRSTSNKILILTAAYVDPNIDTVGMNQLTANVTQAFSSTLQPKISAIGKVPVNVNDTRTTLTPGQKLALHTIHNDAENVVLLSIATPVSNGESAIHLRVRYFDLRYSLQDGKRSSVIPSNGFERSYYLRGPKGDTDLSIDDLVDMFISELKTLKRLPAGSAE